MSGNLPGLPHLRHQGGGCKVAVASVRAAQDSYQVRRRTG